MRRFCFSLDPVLRLRRRQEEEAQLGLAEKQRLLALAQAEVEKLRQEVQSHDLHRAELLSSQVNSDALQEADRFRQVLAAVLLRQQYRAADAGAAVKDALATLDQRRRDREVLERLRERRLAEHQEQELRVEQQALDEAAVLRWRRAP